MRVRSRYLSSIVGAASLIVLSTPQARAQEAPRADTLPRYLLEEIMVTARRAPATRDEIPQQVEVVGRAELERTVALTATEALKKNVTVDVIEYPGLLSGVSVRGFRPQFSGLNPRTLILLDGRPAGITNLSTLDVAVVERIEVLRGPASALYGSSAMGGVINVVTRRSSGAVHGSVNAGYGSFRTMRGDLALGGSLLPALDFDLALAATRRGEGYTTGSRRTFGGESVTKTLSGGRTQQLPELVGDTTLAFSEFGTRSGSLRVGYAVGNGWRVDARGGLFQGDDVQNPGDLNVTAYSTRTLNDLDRRTGDLAVTGQAGAHDLTVRGFAAWERNSYFNNADNPTFVSSRSPNRWHGVQLQDVVSLGRHTVTAGIDHTTAADRSEVFSAAGQEAPPYAAASEIRSTAAFGEARLRLLDERLTATLGGRLDRVGFELREAVLYDRSRVSPNTETHTVFNPSAGVLYRAGALRLHASAGRAFVTPTAFNVAGYSERSAGARAVRVTRGNAELEPESSVTWDAGAGLLRPTPGLELDLTYFHTDVRNRIAAQPVTLSGVQLTPAGDTIRSLTSYVNSDEAAIRGLEASFGYDLGARTGFDYSLRLFADVTRILEAEEITGGARTGIRNVADLTAVFGVELDDLERFGARLSGRYVGERVDTDFSDWMNPGEVRYPEFLVVDLSTSLRLADRYRIGAELANLTDENYYEVRGYNLPGRSLRIHAGVDF